MTGPFRIGIMGSAGSGKTDLARVFSNALEIPLVGEGVREWLINRRHQVPGSLPWELQLELQEHYVANKIREESLHPAFVSDRTTIDAVVNLQLRSFDCGKSAQVPATLVERALEYARQTYGRIVLLRWNGTPQVTPDGVREIDHHVLQREYDLCWSLCKSIGMRITVFPALSDKREVELLVDQFR